MRFVKVVLGLLFLFFMALLPLRVSQYLGRILGKFLYNMKSSRAYRVSKANIDSCFNEVSVDQRESLLSSSLEHTGMSYAEMGMSWLWPTSMSLATVVSVKGEEVLQQAFEQGRGVIIIAPHIGNWEVLNLYASKRYAITVLYKQPKLKFFDWLINKMRKRLGGDMAPANAQGVRKLLKKLKANKVVAILPDQEPAEGGGQFSPFFGRPAYTMTLLSQLAAKTKCQVISGVAVRQEKGRGFAIEFKELDFELSSESINESVNTLNQNIQAITQRNPEQYQWEYKRYKKSPEDLADLY